MNQTSKPNLAPSGKPKLLDRVRATIAMLHYSRRTEKAYVNWIRRYIFFHHVRHPQEMGAAEVVQFLTDLAVQRHVSASTQKQAFNALLFLYKRVLEKDLGMIQGVIRAKKPKRLPLVLNRDEVKCLPSVVPLHRSPHPSPASAPLTRKRCPKSHGRRRASLRSNQTGDTSHAPPLLCNRTVTCRI